MCVCESFVCPVEIALSDKTFENFWNSSTEHELESYSSVSPKFKPYAKNRDTTHIHIQTSIDKVINRYICIWGQGQSRWRQVDTADSSA